MIEETKKWAQARMAPQTWERMRRSATRMSKATGDGAAEARRWLTIGSEHVTSMRAARMEPCPSN